MLINNESRLLVCNLVCNRNSSYAAEPTVVHVGPYKCIEELDVDFKQLKENYAARFT